MNIDQFKKRFGLQMNRPVVIFSDPFCGAMAAIVLTAIVQSPMRYLAKVCVPDYMNVPNAKGNLR